MGISPICLESEVSNASLPAGIAGRFAVGASGKGFRGGCTILGASHLAEARP